MKEIEQSIFIELTDDEPFGCEVILYKDGTSEQIFMMNAAIKYHKFLL